MDSAIEYMAGVGRTVITPAEPMWAAGYASRTKPARGKVHDLWAKALALEDARGTRLVILTTDLLGLPGAMADAVAASVVDRFGLPRERIMLTSSHTHCGPVLGDALADIYRMNDADRRKAAEYSAWLWEALVDVIGAAIGNLAPAVLTCGTGTAGFAGNRRQRDGAGIIIGHDPEGPVDHDVPVLKAAAPDGSIRAVLFGYACHGTTLDIDEWCGDYAGFAQAEIEKAHGGASAMFVAGCGADINPVPRRSLDICRQHGNALADAVEGVLGGGMTTVNGIFRALWRSIDLAFDRPFGREELQRLAQAGEFYQQRWAQRMLARIDGGDTFAATHPYPIQAFRLGDGVTLLALAGEVVVDYGLSLKRELGHDRVWPIAYANDVFGYIPTRRILAEGGYEADDAVVVYGLPARWLSSIEGRIIEAACGLAREAAGPDREE